MTSGKHIAFFTAPSHGHVYPMLGIVEELAGRGHRVSYATTTDFAGAVGAAGAHPVLYASTMPSPGDRSRRWPETITESMTLFLSEAAATLPALREAFAADRPDVVAVDDLAGAGAVLAAAWGVPVVQIWPFFAANAHWSLPQHAPAAQRPKPAAMFRYGTDLTALLRSAGLRTSVPQYFASRPTGGVVLLPRAFQFRGETFGPEFSFVGPCLGSRGFQGEAAPAAADRPTLLISLGTSFNDRPEFYAMCLEAFAGEPWHVVMAVGDRIRREQLPPVPDNIEVHARVPQLAVLARAGAFITHAGMGSIMEGLAHGVPLIAIPQVFEQEVNTERLTGLGLGVSLRRDAITAEGLRDAVRRADGAEVRAAVGRMRAQVQAGGGAPAAADVIEKIAG
ncbi:macrolide family glycosyltransferase [Dactylosporangium sp. NPDC000244]|uniref:macrolide family glycosyltransferase n=1 Tax=Dactylosporangium sp. NPDC000244 TaxID=3154365 RepID=UPI00332E9C94